MQGEIQQKIISSKCQKLDQNLVEHKKLKLQNKQACNFLI